MASRLYRSRDLKRPETESFDSVEELGIALKLIAERPLVHIGLLYKGDGDPVRLCHFAGHFDLRDELPPEGFRWLQVTLNPILRRLVVTMCQTLALRKDNVPYGFTFDGPYFDPRTAEYIKHPVGHGLTCASFVLAVFRAMAIELLDTPTWPNDRLEDLAWQTFMIAVVREKYRLVADSLAAKVGNPRFRPEEVAAGAIIQPNPVKFAETVPIAEKILNDLRKA